MGHDEPGGDLIAVLRRGRYLIVTAAAFGLSVSQFGSSDHGGEWREIFVVGSELLFGIHHPYSLAPGGLHLYANYPAMQVGPLALVVATPLRLVGSDSGVDFAALAMTCLVPLLVFLIERMALQRGALARGGDLEAEEVQRLELTALVGGLLVAAAWSTLAGRYGHVDDALAIAAMVSAVAAVVRRRPWLAGVAVGIGIASKPWALLFIPLLLVFEHRDRWRALGSAVVVSVLAWGPFVIADPKTLEAVRPTVDTDLASVLHLFGVARGAGPGWARAAQLVCGLGVGLVLVARGRFTALPVAAIAVRILFDPGVWPYYTAGLVVAALVWDLTTSGLPLPLMSAVAFVGLDVVDEVVAVPTARALIRLITLLAILLWTLAGPTTSPWQRRSAGSGTTERQPAVT